MRKIKEFILRDGLDTQFDDLITFDEAIDFKELIKLIEDTKEKVEDYTNEDIYKAIDKLKVPYTIKFIGCLSILTY